MLFFQLCTLDGLAVYLNTTSEQFSKNSESNYSDLFYSGIATIDYNPLGYQYCKHNLNTYQCVHVHLYFCIYLKIFLHLFSTGSHKR